MLPRSLFDDEQEEPELLPLQAEKPAAAAETAENETRSRCCGFLLLDGLKTNVVTVSRGDVAELEVIACVDNPEMIGHRITQADPRLKPWQWRAILFDLLERRV